MNIYELINEFVVVKKHGLSASLYDAEKREKLDTDKDKKLFDLLKNVSSLATKMTDKGIEFHPFLRWEGNRTFSIEDLTEDDYTELSAVDLTRLPLNLKARIADILWVKKKNYKAACIAVETYLALFNNLFSDEDWVGTLDIIKRAICIAAQINKQELYNECCQTVYNHIIRIDGTDDKFLSLSLMEIVLKQKYGDMTVILNIINKIICSDGNIHKIERAYGLKVECLRIQKDDKAIKNANVDLAIYYEKQAESILNSNLQGAMRAETFLQKAIIIYRNNGKSEEGERVHRRLVDIQKEIPKLLLPITTKVDIRGLVANINLNMEELSFAECVIRLTQMIIFYKKEDMKNQLLDEYEEYPLSHIFGRNIINNSGQTVLTLPPLDWKNPEKDSELLDMHIFQKMLQFQTIAGNMALKYALLHIRELHEFQMEDLDFLVKDNPIIPEGRERILQSAIYMILKGQYYEGIHILAPQVENIFRNIAKEVGGLTVTLENDGSSKEKVLSSIFDLPELMDCYDNDILFVFKGLLNEQAGANIRNEVAHGILNEGSAASGACLYFACAVIKLLSYTSLGCYEIIKKNPKLHTYVELEEEALELKK